MNKERNIIMGCIRFAGMTWLVFTFQRLGRLDVSAGPACRCRPGGHLQKHCLPWTAKAAGFLPQQRKDEHWEMNSQHGVNRAEELASTASGQEQNFSTWRCQPRLGCVFRIQITLSRKSHAVAQWLVQVTPGLVKLSHENSHHTNCRSYLSVVVINTPTKAA